MGTLPQPIFEVLQRTACWVAFVDPAWDDLYTEFEIILTSPVPTRIHNWLVSSRQAEGKHMDLCWLLSEGLLLKRRDLARLSSCTLSLKQRQCSFSFPAGNVYSFTALGKWSLQWTTLLLSTAYLDKKAKCKDRIQLAFCTLTSAHPHNNLHTYN